MKQIVLFILALLVADVWAQKKPQTATLSFDAALYSGVRWREVGPYRGGRSCTVTGVVGNPNLYYFGTVGGGVWRTHASAQRRAHALQ